MRRLRCRLERSGFGVLSRRLQPVRNQWFDSTWGGRGGGGVCYCMAQQWTCGREGGGVGLGSGADAAERWMGALCFATRCGVRSSPAAADVGLVGSCSVLLVK